ncbi:hypothetical protein VTO73DRAFT_11679 [Trametes versicolor]
MAVGRTTKSTELPRANGAAPGEPAPCTSPATRTREGGGANARLVRTHLWQPAAPYERRVQWRSLNLVPGGGREDPGRANAGGSSGAKTSAVWEVAARRHWYRWMGGAWPQRVASVHAADERILNVPSKLVIQNGDQGGLMTKMRARNSK